MHAESNDQTTNLNIIYTYECNKYTRCPTTQVDERKRKWDLIRSKLQLQDVECLRKN